MEDVSTPDKMRKAFGQVAEGIAQRYGVSKSELLSPEAGDLCSVYESHKVSSCPPIMDAGRFSTVF